jgi:hypothetical protein
VLGRELESLDYVVTDEVARVRRERRGEQDLSAAGDLSNVNGLLKSGRANQSQEQAKGQTQSQSQGAPIDLGALLSGQPKGNSPVDIPNQLLGEQSNPIDSILQDLNGKPQGGDRDKEGNKNGNGVQIVQIDQPIAHANQTKGAETSAQALEATTQVGDGIDPTVCFPY